MSRTRVLLDVTRGILYRAPRRIVSPVKTAGRSFYVGSSSVLVRLRDGMVEPQCGIPIIAAVVAALTCCGH